jgi:FKBP-type peptidyl-prolyl cis-trans isomerase 2
VPLITSSSQVGLIWLEGTNNGGTPVIDYQVAYGEDTASYVSLETGITNLEHTVLGLTAGTTYKFKVQARNAYGLSEFSTEVLILVAQIPDAPTDIVTSIVDFDVKIKWTPPSD